MLVSTHWLANNLGDVILLDASMSKVVGKTPIEYDQPTYIPGSLKLDLENELVDPHADMVNAFPTPVQFAEVASNLGIEADSQVVIYDNQGLYSSPRAWWIFYAMGFKRVKVLDGGLPQWIADGYKTSDMHASAPAKSSIQPNFEQQLVCDAAYVLGCTNDESVAIIDARAGERFRGEVAEPRSGMRSGHIPSSLNLPFAQVLDGHKFKSEADLKTLFAELVPTGGKLVFSCGSGITACIIMLAAHIAGYTDTSLYDGSWAEWGGNEALPIS
ncbi:sulfurtransferase [Salinibius halmophilus]|uniref:sulfurtransferase n=1 Tax=Salinibius halmophilus TaxID=1853216 RepID=UPI000E66BB62|nr:sulfurtransferase [Salinibius halmophilus]